MIPINDWSLQRTTVLTPLHLPELTQEQSVELDYVLPDYYPDFFRLLHCTAEAAVTEQTDIADFIGGIAHNSCLSFITDGRASPAKEIVP